MIKVLTVFGTRPEAIKLAPVIRELRRHPAEISCHVCVTAQHREMLDQVLSLFAIATDADLDVMQPDQDLAYVMSTALTRVSTVIRDLQPDWVVVQGDTTTAMATAMAAFYERNSGRIA